jgi:leucine dehydrogenase
MSPWDLLEDWDGEAVVVRRDRPSGAWIFIAVHSTRLGPAAGGTRMRTYPDPGAALRDALRLAEAMTLKYAVPGFPRGGGKAVIAVPPDLDPAARTALLRRYGELVRELGGLFLTGPDVGTSSEDMDVIGETGSPYVFARTPARGGAGGSGPATALGVFAALEAAAGRVFGEDSLRDRHVLVQGAGSVGGALIERLLAAGARVSFSDVDPGAVRRFRDERGLEYVPPEAVFETPCDLFSPCALGGVLNEATIPRLRCRAVAGAANNQLATPEDAERLRARGILYAPDFVVSLGGAMAVTGLEAMGWTPAQAEREVLRIGDTLRKVFDRAEADGLTTEAAARRIARETLAAVTPPSSSPPSPG